MADFDPYWQWLKIPPDRRPPSPHDLLGLPPGEADEANVRQAAAKRYKHVRSYVLGHHAADANRILNQLAQAVVALTGGQQRTVVEPPVQAASPATDWLVACREPADFYELLDEPRFLPDFQRLDAAIRTAREQLKPRGHEAAARRLLGKLDEGQQALSDPQAFQRCHGPILARLWERCIEEYGEDASRWDMRRVQALLTEIHKVYPALAGSVALAMRNPEVSNWELLLGEMYWRQRPVQAEAPPESPPAASKVLPPIVALPELPALAPMEGSAVGVDGSASAAGPGRAATFANRIGTPSGPCGPSGPRRDRGSGPRRRSDAGRDRGPTEHDLAELPADRDDPGAGDCRGLRGLVGRTVGDGSDVGRVAA